MHDSDLNADLTKAVMTDDSGEWYIVPVEHVSAPVTNGRESVIVHQCHLWNKDLESPNGLPYQPLGFWNGIGSVEIACKLCNVRPPEKIATLWKLHNFDTFAGRPAGSTDMSRWITAVVRTAQAHYEHTFFIGSKACVCKDCSVSYGERV